QVRPRFGESMIIYAISGKLKCGKTTLANLLSYRRVSFGDPVKRECSDTYGIPLHFFYEKKDALVSVQGQYMTIRKLLQWHGTDYRRAQDPLYWVKKFDEQLPNEDCVIDDVRFVEEAEYCKSKKAVLVRLEPYPGYSYYSAHKSETELDNYDCFDLVLHPKFGELQLLVEVLDADTKN
ncbi:hypothetical protein KAU11_08415, partial [Candidatus Babeliales bacterium]|nr:hypothetical protein [Candidatus Babeliales bacterium]